MKVCCLCELEFDNWIVIEGKKRNLTNRKYCLSCSPFKLHNTRPINSVIVESDKKDRKTYKKDYWSRQDVKANKNGYMKERREAQKRVAIDYKGGACVVCGYNRCARSLAFHHCDPTKKEFGLSSKGLLKEWSVIKVELDKCVLLCSNCHMEVHTGIITLDNLL